MNVFDTTERAPGEQGARLSKAEVTPPARMLTWRGVDGGRLESARVLTSGGRLRALGQIIAAATDDTPALTVSYELHLDDQGGVRRLLVHSITAEEERHLSISHSREGIWLVDRGDNLTGGEQRVERTELDGALDVDLAGSALFATLPVNRLGLTPESGAQDVPMAFVGLPDLAVEPVQRRYELVRDEPEGRIVALTSNESTVELVMDADGFTLDCPGLARRI
ncbi:putative glycolipid-binding domain-containing protein [Actinoalloteichus hymeniacidonis]|uniref:Glycolipid-binding domain-containing protein n=1 Tax=Actinoalloteichus hymeniacidonis TaxID=340345 RepID=A0AAC9MWN7_9PSEU|nr:putative glycolipid-binding domain-containing protein [Actinoalloteichus hymeniacidonis]AOS61007.1 hypothetical protein TL08_00810 [Actinoalloteichus hymeniacidonis]MBB5910993.1 hypothetical protein [Actinoalloteichus hymeniacidonis]